jgi:hypothetical protein
MKIDKVKVGDVAVRQFCDDLQFWNVTEVTDTHITIGLGWTFRRDTGIEEDEECPSVSTISYILRIIEVDFN